MKSGDLKLNVVIILSVIGIIVSLYLVQSHFALSSAGSFCDVSDTVSCSLVNSSVYSTLLGVPVALFGVFWFLILGLMAQRAKKNKLLLSPLVSWNILGILFVIYLIIAEIILRALCPLCTVVHVITLITFILAIILYKNLPATEKNKAKKDFLKIIKPWLILIIILNLILFIVFNLPAGQQEDHSELAQCISKQGVNMYGSFRCSVCAKTRAMFSDSFQYINEIECHPQGENSQTALCLEKDLEGTPTWILEPNGKEQKRHTGFLNLEELAEFSGCDME